jgi:hypothetical protein
VLNDEHCTKWVVGTFCPVCNSQADQSADCCPGCGVLFDDISPEKKAVRNFYDCGWWQCMFTSPKKQFKDEE